MNFQSTILLLDDSTFARRVSRQVLQSLQIENILEADSGTGAIDLLSTHSPPIDVVFCDLMMPDMDGVQFVRHASALTTPPSIIFVSSADASLMQTAEETAKARGLRVLGTIQKPIMPDSVRRVLLRLGDRRHGNSACSSIRIEAKDIKNGIEANEFLLHFQPKVSVSSGELTGYESLVRWSHPAIGMIPPGSFISSAEKTGQIGALTDHITNLALRQLSAWAESGFQTKVSINLSAFMLVDLGLPDRLSSEVECLGIDPQSVILEITESGLFQNPANTMEILARLHMKGFHLSIDDFGTGFSSMEQLRRVPFREMKIDGAFVRGAAENVKARAILESSANLGRALHMTVVAEGAETKEDWNVLREAGIDIVQGYLFGKPMPAADARDWACAFPPS